MSFQINIVNVNRIVFTEKVKQSYGKKKNTEDADNLKRFCESSGHAEIKVFIKLGQINCAFNIIAAFSKCNYYQLQFFLISI